MSDPGLYLKNKNELFDWFKKEMPESYSEYLAVYEKIKTSKFPGSIKLSLRENTQEVAGFGAFLTELNPSALSRGWFSLCS